MSIQVEIQSNSRAHLLTANDSGKSATATPRLARAEAEAVLGSKANSQAPLSGLEAAPQLRAAEQPIGQLASLKGLPDIEAALAGNPEQLSATIRQVEILVEEQKQLMKDESSATIGVPFAGDKAYKILGALLQVLELLRRVERDASSAARESSRDLTALSGQRTVEAAEKARTGAIASLAVQAGMQASAVGTSAKAAKTATDSINTNVKRAHNIRTETASADLHKASTVGKGNSREIDGNKAPEGGIDRMNGRRDVEVRHDNNRDGVQSLDAQHQLQMIKHAKLNQIAQSVGFMAMPTGNMISASAEVDAAHTRAASDIARQASETESQNASDRADQSRNNKQSMDQTLEALQENRRRQAEVANHIASQL